MFNPLLLTAPITQILGTNNGKNKCHNIFKCHATIYGCISHCIHEIQCSQMKKCPNNKHHQRGQAGAVSSHPMMPKISPSPALLLRHIWSCLCRFCDTYGLCQLSNRFQAPLLWQILAPLDWTIFSQLFLSLESALNWRQALAKPQFSLNGTS